MAEKDKKSSRKKTVAPRKSNTPLTKTDVEHFKQLLLLKRHEIVGDVSGMGEGILTKSRLDASGDLSSMPIHMADIASDNYEQEFVLGLMDSERKLLRELDSALERIEQGTYGICEIAPEPIGKVRLEARPWARYCIDCARKLEQGSAPESEEEEESDQLL